MEVPEKKSEIQSDIERLTASLSLGQFQEVLDKASMHLKKLKLNSIEQLVIS